MPRTICLKKDGIFSRHILHSKGWNFQQAYTSFYEGNVIHHWIFYKEADSQEEARKGIMTKEKYKQIN